MTGANAWIAEAVARLAPQIGAEEAARDARLILRAATGWSALQVAVAGVSSLEPEAAAAADAMLARRETREPLAQILGQWPFFGRDFFVTRDVLTPRPDTETLVELALDGPFRRLIDLGTGSGAIAVTLLAERAETTGFATDRAAAALVQAARNAVRHGIDGRLSLMQADWWRGVPEAGGGPFDLLVSNPPYVTEAAYAALAPEITRFEPRGALTPGGDGLDAYRAILAGPVEGGLGAVLTPGARVLLEIGPDQGAAVTALARAAGLENVVVHPDIDGRDRVVAALWPGRPGGVTA